MKEKKHAHNDMPAYVSPFEMVLLVFKHACVVPQSGKINSRRPTDHNFNTFFDDIPSIDLESVSLRACIINLVRCVLCFMNFKLYYYLLYYCLFKKHHILRPYEIYTYINIHLFKYIYIIAAIAHNTKHYKV